MRLFFYSDDAKTLHEDLEYIYVKCNVFSSAKAYSFERSYYPLLENSIQVKDEFLQSQNFKNVFNSNSIFDLHSF